MGQKSTLFFRKWTKNHQIVLANVEKNRRPQRRFPIADCSIRSRDMRDQSLQLSENYSTVDNS